MTVMEINMQAIQHHVNWFTSSSNLISLGSIAIAFASAVYARSMAKISKRSLELAEQQDSRREPKLSLYLSDAYALISNDSTVIAVSITVTNPTDIDNSIARAELSITYHRKEGQAIRMSIPPTRGDPERTYHVSNLLSPPVSIPSHQSVAGLLIFELPAIILADSNIVDEYTLSVEDSHEKTVTLDNLTVRESFES
jgi:hypothetical protein